MKRVSLPKNMILAGWLALQYVEVPVPVPSKNEVLLKVEATALNPADIKTQRGTFRPFIPRKFPYIPATDVAGEVVEAGAGVQNFKVGDKVVAYLNYFTGGGLAEYVVAKESLTVPRPPEVSAAEGACLSTACLIAYQAITEASGIKLDGSSHGKNILVTAASGGVGHYAVQLAKLCGAHVTATCGSRNIDFVRSLGADEVLDYKTPEGAKLVNPSGKKYDVVVHCAMGIPWAVFEPNLDDRGKVIDLTPNASAMWTSFVKRITMSKKTMVQLRVNPKGEDLDFLVKLMKGGKIKTVIDSKYPLTNAHDAWAKVIDGHATGKIIVDNI